MLKSHLLVMLTMLRALAMMALLNFPTVYASAEIRPVSTFNLADYRGEVVYLDFWASWCVPCHESFPWMAHMQQTHAGDGLRVITVSVDTQRDDAENFLAKHASALTVFHDPEGEMATRYDLAGMPSSFVIGRDGQVLYAHSGFRDQDIPELEHAIEEALQR